MRIGIDTGGTFTDFVIQHGDGALESFKLRSSPASPHEVILEGLRRIGADPRCEIIHGSTVATNAFLERKGARTAFVTTAGFEDLLEIGRQCRGKLYDLTPGPKRLLIPRRLCFGVRERMLASGQAGLRPARGELLALRQRLEKAGAESVAICCLHAYRNPAHERLIARALGRRFFLSVSSEISPEFREYERASTTALNAYVGPLMSRYLAALGRRAPGSLFVMQSNGGLLTAAEAGRLAVRTILSGPAGGVRGAAGAARASGFQKIIGFDMGGTSTDVSLCDGEPRETVEGSVGGFPIRVPMLEIHTVGAGGGSIARVDPGGLLRVGPESAGADPGPACYGSSLLPTVTDAHVVLGRISADQLAGGAVRIHPERSARAISPIAKALGTSLEEAAAGILRVANATMTRAIRVVSIERGVDPRGFALVAFGGCGGLHACELARELDIATVLVPDYAGALSALGMLIADRMRDYSASVLGERGIEDRFRQLEQLARREAPGATLLRTADLRYRGQSYELTVPWNAEDPARPFHEAHERRYGYANPSRPVEVVQIRVRALAPVQPPALRRPSRPGRRGIEKRRVYAAGQWFDMPVLARGQVSSRWADGPALVVDAGSTTLIPPGWRFRLDEAGAVVIHWKR
ncbi:MAG: hydantoinase/oxoprolinase family protein [Bryobacteraceae bacterium]|nr:hydantoinase/oxoprolinase family protein [Bryobacteraceae bacterium]